MWRATIWSPSALPPYEHKYRSLKRVWFPLYYAIIAGVGVAVTLGAFPPLVRTYGPSVAVVGGVLLAAVGVGAVVGSVIPRLWRLELAVVILIFGVLAACTAAAWLAPHGSVGHALVLAPTMIPPLMHLSILGEEIKGRRAR